MNIKDSNRHFEKLSSFYKQVSADGHLNKIELELLKSYVTKFYESIIDGDTSIAKKSTSEPIARVETPVATVVPVSPPKVTVPEPTIAEQAPAEVLIESSVDVPKKQSKDIEQLFSLEKGTEISDRLSISSIKDINKAMSINERIFTIKELFGGSQEQFDKTISSLNGLMSYDDAKNYLSENIVNDNNWLDPEKTKKVKTFLKLIYRKYV